jgi:hypothetical protein
VKKELKQLYHINKEEYFLLLYKTKLSVFVTFFKQNYFSSEVICTGLWIRIDLMQIQIRNQGFDEQKKKITAGKLFYIFLIAIYLFLGLHKGRTSYRRWKRLQPQKRTSSTSKHEKSLLFSISVGHFCPPGSGSGSSSSNYCRSRSGFTTLDLHHVCCRVL